MKKVIQIVAALIAVIGVSATETGATAHAQQTQNGTCTSIVISNTGSNSINNGICTVVTTVTATCTNNVYDLDSNTQTAVTGQASQLGNTGTGTAISGSAVNSNGTTIQLGTSCAPQQTATTTTTPTSTTTATPTATVPAPQKVKTLPFTAGNSNEETILIAIIAVATVLLSIRFAVTAYQRVSTK